MSLYIPIFCKNKSFALSYDSINLSTTSGSSYILFIKIFNALTVLGTLQLFFNFISSNKSELIVRDTALNISVSIKSVYILDVTFTMPKV